MDEKDNLSSLETKFSKSEVNCEQIYKSNFTDSIVSQGYFMLIIFNQSTRYRE